MAKFAIAWMGFALVASCSYDASRLLRPAAESSIPDGSKADTPGDGREDAMGKPDTRDAGAANTRDAGSWENVDAIRDSGRSSSQSSDADLGGTGVAGASTVATFVSGRGQGALTGYGHIGLGVVDSVSSPTCNGMPIGGVTPSAPPVTFSSTCRPSAITWGTTVGLCVSGTIPAWSTNRSYVDSMINWGILVGVATREPVQAIGVSYATMALTVSGWDSEPLLAVVHLADDPSNLTYCAWADPGEAVKLSTFNTECYFNSGKGLSDKDVDKIDKIGVQVPSSRSAVTLSDFCLMKIEFAK